MNTSQKRSSFAALLAAAVLAGAPVAEASVRVYGEASSTGPTVDVRIYADITSPAIVSFSFKLFYPAARLEVLSAAHNATVWYFYDGARTVPYPTPVTSVPGEVLFTGARMDARNPLTGVTGNHVLLGSVTFRRTTSDAPSFDLSIGRPGQFASFVAVDGTVLEAQPGQVAIQGISNDPADSDLDGLTDRWEETYFGSIKDAFYSDDSDRDGVNNQSEEAMGSDPTDPRSFLQLAIVGGKEKYVLEWSSVEGRSYTVEASRRLDRFEPLKEGLAATPPRNTFELDRSELGEIMFFRIRVDPVVRR